MIKMIEDVIFEDDTWKIVNKVTITSNKGIEDLINIKVDEMDTTTTNAPITGSLLFNLDAVLSIPQNISKDELINSLNILSEKYNVKYDLLLFKPE
jgi:glycine cleavage system regulatory protein